VHAINRVSQVSYAEIVATISSKSAGPGTRANIDEFTETTARGLEVIGGAKRGRAIIVLNPAEPPIMMRDTVYALVEEDADEHAIAASIAQTVASIQSYVPGYRLRTVPMFDGNKVTVFLEVEGAGDYLPKYSGNLDIMTATAVKVAEEFAKHHVSTASV
jgi:acetaldehyde dehydrogenase (acetylating)